MFDSMLNETGGYSHSDLIAEPSQPLASCPRCRPAQELAQAPFVLVLCRIPNIFLPSLRHGRKCLRHPARCYWCGLETYEWVKCGRCWKYIKHKHVSQDLTFNPILSAQICTNDPAQWFCSKVLPPWKEHFPHICAWLMSWKLCSWQCGIRWLQNGYSFGAWPL